MITAINELLLDTQVYLDAIEQQSNTRVEQSERSLVVLKQAQEKMKQLVIAQCFHTLEEEVWYFKEAAPAIFSRLIFFNQLYRFESRRAVKGTALEGKQLQDILQHIENFIIRNADLYSYYHSQVNDFDELLFTRSKPHLHLLDDDELILLDSRYCTPAGFKMAKFNAYERLQRYLIPTTGAAVSSPEKKILWTDQKSALIELVYGLYATRSIDNGKATVKDIASILEKAFHTDLSNYYRAMQNMRIRKINRTKYLDLLKQNLEKLMDDTDEWGRA